MSQTRVVEIVFETHAISQDNERGVASGWDHSRLSERGRDAARVHADRQRFLDSPYPGGESWRQAVSRVGGFFDDLSLRWSDKRILLIGHVATRWACDHLLKGIPLEELAVEDFAWREGWEYCLES